MDLNLAEGCPPDANSQLGVAPAGSPLSANELLKQQRVVQELKATTERQAAVIALQEGHIKTPNCRPTESERVG
jgi:hypothetical protein